MAGTNPQLSCFIHNATNATRNLYENENAHSTSDSIEAYNLYTPKGSNQVFDLSRLGLNTYSSDTTGFKVERQLGTPNASPKKRSKATHRPANVISSSKSKGKKKKSLSLLLEMPLDVLYEIFGHLHPRDMINLTRTSKIFRETLLSRNATTVWKAMLDRGGAPDCPSWMSEPAWAALLFEHVCQSCGARNIQKIDFLLMRRVCLKCKKVHLVNESGVLTRYPETFNLDISGTLPATNISSWSHKYTSKSKFYWDGDVEDMLSRLSTLRDTESGLPNTQRLLDDYMEEKKRRVESIKEKFDLWNDWHTNTQSAKRLACVFESFSASWRKAILNSQVISGFVADSTPALPNPGNLPTQSQSREDPFWCQLFEKDVDDIDFEKEFATMFDEEEDVFSSKNDLEHRVDRDSDPWWMDVDFDWCDNIYNLKDWQGTA